MRLGGPQAEQEEELIANKLIKRLELLKREKQSLAREVEQEEEYLTNNLQKRMTRLGREKADLENRLEAEQVSQGSGGLLSLTTSAVLRAGIGTRDPQLYLCRWVQGYGPGTTCLLPNKVPNLAGWAARRAQQLLSSSRIWRRSTLQTSCRSRRIGWEVRRRRC